MNKLTVIINIIVLLFYTMHIKLSSSHAGDEKIIEILFRMKERVCPVYKVHYMAIVLAG